MAVQILHEKGKLSMTTYMGRLDAPKSQVDHHQADPAPSSALFDAKALGVEEVSNHEATGNIGPRDHEGAQRTRPNVHVLCL